MKELKNVKGFGLAAHQFNEWQEKSVIYFFPEYDEVETYVYASSNEWDEFKAPAISLVYKNSTTGRDDKISAKRLEKLTEYYISRWNAGQREFDETDELEAYKYAK